MTFEITKGELEYQASQVFAGKTFKVFLANTGVLTSESTISQWEQNELASAYGYSAVTGTVGSGAFNNTTLRFEMPVISGTFGPASGIGFTYDAIVVKLQGRSKPYAVNLLANPVSLAAGQSRGFSIKLGIKQ